MGLNSQIPLANTSLLSLFKFEVLENGRTKYIASVNCFSVTCAGVIWYTEKNENISFVKQIFLVVIDRIRLCFYTLSTEVELMHIKY